MTDDPQLQGVACEPDEIQGKWLFAGLLVLILMLVGVGLALNGLTRIDVIHTQSEEDIAAGHKYIEAMRARDAAELKDYSRNSDGSYQVPIELAMEAVVMDAARSQGEPEPSPPNQGVK